MNASTAPSAASRTRRRRIQLAAAAFLAAGLTGVAAQPASAQVLVAVPPGCGSLSGTMVVASRLDDHSTGPAIGTAGSPYQTLGNVDMITVGSAFGDNIEGNGVSETICGRGGDDTLTGGSGGADLIFGGAGVDTISGNANNDELHGGDRADVIHGDNATNSNGVNDGVDFIFGGDGADTLSGGDARDVFNGGGGVNDEVEVGPAGDNDQCSLTELPALPVAGACP